MNIEYIKNHYYFETLTEEHDLSKFSCDSEDLNDFLKNDALNQQKEKLNLTKLCICDGEIVGFVTLLTDVLKLNLVRDENVKELIKGKLHISIRNNISSIKIGRFAIDKKYSGKGLGSFILINVIDNIINLSENNVGLRFIVVNAYAKAYTFYVNHIGFENLKKDDKILENIDFIKNVDPERTFLLYLDIKNLC
ncbi:MAG: GNAT family N-acetyltransferase [Methanobrevibacter sp.]|uniref:GNAT family N-acetyltransferase n=1 Tax=Methanobrevibacter sp. TaxID=66852 RepID=UPI0025E94F2C|nr:GNAT family N-acetyltransferase [Methanobrevibacter sp.]MBR0270369.1 GNAT family N-acetyltransferase [Methanobrevibacter sp.]